VKRNVHAWTDGSCETRTGEGGWAFLLAADGQARQVSGYEPDTTNNRMELTAAVRALETLREPCRIEITTDSQYLKNAFTQNWLKNWQRNGWRTASRQPVKNRDLWERLLELTADHDVTWSWTRGHSGHRENELVDRLALQARRTRTGTDRRLTL